MLLNNLRFLLLVFLFIGISDSLFGQYESIKSSLIVQDFSEEEYKEDDLDKYLHFIINENSYQEAFTNLVERSYTYDFHMTIEGLSGQNLVDYKGTGTSKKKDGCRHVQFEDREIQGVYYRKNDKLKFYTAKLLETFVTGLEKNCEDLNQKKESRLQELLEILLSPGMTADLQFIGYKTDLFSEEMSKYYNYKISQANYNNELDCVVFEMGLKPEYRERKKKKTIIKSLKCYYNKKTNTTIAKELVFSYKTPLQNYDINFNVEFEMIGGRYYPKSIEYDGVWVVIPHKTEVGKFIIEYSNLFP